MTYQIFFIFLFLRSRIGMYVRRRKQYINALSQRAHIHKNSKHNDFDYIINNFINPELGSFWNLFGGKRT